jgi:starch-binding outer membrane protein, SusD/RagB family
MKQVSLQTTIFFVLLTTFISCGKGFLDVKPTNYGDAATSVNTVADAKVMINGIMRNMTNANYYGCNFILYGDVKGGDLTIFSQGRGMDALYTFNHTVTTNNYSGFWSTIYNNILQVNNLIESIHQLQLKGTTENFDSYKGQALTARALMYFDLVRIYGKSYTDDKASYGVPNITTKLEASAQPLRASVEENYTQILSDLTIAAPLLSKTKSNGYLNYWGNKAIMARVYLSMGNNQAALAAAQSIIDSSGYTLYTPANWVPSWKTQFGTESIFELGMYPSEGDLGIASLGFYLRKKGYGSSSAMGWFTASDYYLNRLNEDPTDIRWGVMGDDEVSTSTTLRKGACYKYSGSVNLEGDGKSTVTAVNIKVIRLSEIYLIAAEAALSIDKEKAATYVNAIRKRSPALAPVTAANISLDIILNEKSKELFAEGQHYFDMIRLNKSITFNDEYIGISLASRATTINRSFNKTLLPVPIAEINANPGIKAQQNAGY